MKKMNRREAVQTLSILLGGTVVSSQAFLNWSCSESVGNIFDEKAIFLFGEIANTIIPETDSPGARDAGVGAFIPLILKDCYEKDVHEKVKVGLVHIQEKSKELFSSDFEKCTADEKLKILQIFDEEQSKHDSQKDGVHFFRLLKELTLLGYFTSEMGATKALRYLPVPGRHEACIDLKDNNKIIVQL